MNHARDLKIFNIPCRIRARRIRDAITRVLCAIREHPRDWGRVQRRVRAFEYFELHVEDDRALGEWVVDPEDALRLNRQADNSAAWGRPDGRWQAFGSIRLSRRIARMNDSNILAIIAHECGHAATRENDFERRAQLDSEWGSELCADFYAARWGFLDQLRGQAVQRSFAHHAVLPGEYIAQGDGDSEHWFRVDRHFYLRPVKPPGPRARRTPGRTS